MKIAVVGSINMDLVVTSDRIPLKGETLLGKEIIYNAGGKGANQAVAAAKLGADVSMYGLVGDDSAANQLVDNLKKYNINTDNIKFLKDTPTGLAIITVAENDNTIIVIQGANDKVDIKYIDSIKDDLLKNDIILIQNEIPKETVEYVIELCNKMNKKIILNPAPIRPIEKKYIDMITYITPNEHEAKILFGEMKIEDILKENKNKIIVTLGSEGVISSDEEGRILKVNAIKVNVVDTTGAGDTFNGAFAYAITKEDNLEKALKFATYASGISVEKMGAQTGMPSFDEVEKRMGE